MTADTDVQEKAPESPQIESPEEAVALIMSATERMALSQDIGRAVSLRLRRITMIVSAIFLCLGVWLGWQMFILANQGADQIASLQSQNAYLQGQVDTLTDTRAYLRAQVETLQNQLLAAGVTPVTVPVPSTAPDSGTGSTTPPAPASPRGSAATRPSATTSRGVPAPAPAPVTTSAPPHPGTVTAPAAPAAPGTAPLLPGLLGGGGLLGTGLGG